MVNFLLLGRKELSLVLSFFLILIFEYLDVLKLFKIEKEKLDILEILFLDKFKKMVYLE